MSTILAIKNLSHRYSGSWAVRDINIEVDQKGVIGLLGSNGAGKSTIMNIMCGALKPTEGEVYINGISIREKPEPAKMQLGYLPQTPPLYPDFTVNEYLTFAADLRLIDRHKVKKAVEEVMEKCNISHFSSRLIKNLSGGYRQRVGIAQSIIHKPLIVIMDEPTNGLDPNQIIEVRKLIKEISAEHTVVLSSHVLSEISILCREIIMIDRGEIVFADTMEAFNNYVQPTSVLAKMDNLPPEAELLQIPGISKVQYLTGSVCRLYFEGSPDITRVIVEQSVRNNWQLREISLEKSLLDDVFKQLSTEPISYR